MHCAALDDAVDSRFNAGAAETASRDVSGAYRNRKGVYLPDRPTQYVVVMFLQGMGGARAAHLTILTNLMILNE